MNLQKLVNIYAIASIGIIAYLLLIPHDTKVVEVSNQDTVNQLHVRIKEYEYRADSINDLLARHPKKVEIITQHYDTIYRFISGASARRLDSIIRSNF